MPVHPRVDDGDDDGRAARGGRPRFGRVDVGVRRPHGSLHRLARVVEAPELAEGGIVGERVDGVDGIGLGEAHTRVPAKLGESAGAVGGGHRRHEGADGLQAGIRRRVRLLERVTLCSQADTRVETHEDPRARLVIAAR